MTAAAYLTGLADLPAWAIEKACRHLGYRAREAYEDKWPELGTIRTVAIAEMRADAERAESKRLLTAHGEPADPARLQRFLDDIKAEIRRKAMR